MTKRQILFYAFMLIELFILSYRKSLSLLSALHALTTMTTLVLLLIAIILGATSGLRVPLPFAIVLEHDSLCIGHFGIIRLIRNEPWQCLLKTCNLTHWNAVWELNLKHDEEIAEFEGFLVEW